jgi:hypothetical protein
VEVVGFWNALAVGCGWQIKEEKKDEEREKRWDERFYIRFTADRLGDEGVDGGAGKKAGKTYARPIGCPKEYDRWRALSKSGI